MTRTTTVKIGLMALALTVLLSGCVFVLNWLDSDANLTVQLTWSDENTDLDLYVTYPDPVMSTVDSGFVPVYSSILDAYDAKTSLPNLGFFPEDGATYRGRVYQESRQSADGNMSYRRPGTTAEIVELFDIPFVYGPLGSGGDYNTGSSAANALPSGYTYAWVGVMEVYIYGERGTVSDAGNVTVKIFNEDDREILSIPVDEETYIKGMSVVRIPVFRTNTGRNYYQLLLDKRLMTDDTGIRSLGSEAGDFLVVGSFADEKE